MAKLGKRFRKKVSKVIGKIPLVQAIKKTPNIYTAFQAIKDKAAEFLGYEKAGEGGDGGGGSVGPDANAQLESELAVYRGAGEEGRKQAEADARRAGTFSDTRAFQTQLAGEGGARARGLKSASLARINALRKQLGLPEAAEGSL